MSYPNSWESNKKNIQKGMNAEPTITLHSQHPTDGKNFKEAYPSDGA